MNDQWRQSVGWVVTTTDACVKVLRCASVTTVTVLSMSTMLALHDLPGKPTSLRRPLSTVPFSCMGFGKVSSWEKVHDYSIVALICLHFKLNQLLERKWTVLQNSEGWNSEKRWLVWSNSSSTRQESPYKRGTKAGNAPWQFPAGKQCDSTECHVVRE